MSNKKHERGDINFETEMIFSHYKGNGKEQWYSQEAWNKKIKKQKEFIKTDKSKEYQKQWYLKNKVKKLKQSKINSEKLIEEYPLKALLSNIKSGAKNRNLDFKINYEFILKLWKVQNGLCYYTKIPMKLTARQKNPHQVSIDRINSNLGYTEENTVLCCQAINYMKNDYSLEDFNMFKNSLQEALKLIK
jgi:hypothetical protein